MLFSGYVVYVIVCSYFETTLSFFTKAKKSAHNALRNSLSVMNRQSYYGSTISKKDLYQGKMDYVMEKKNLCDEPVGNWKSVEYFMPGVSTEDSIGLSSISENSMIGRRGSMADSIRSLSMDNKILKSLLKVSQRPSEMNALYNIHINDFKQEMSCFLFQRSIFYNKAYFGSKAWELRWFTISRELISSVPDCWDPHNHRLRYPRFKAIEVDEKRLIMKILNPVEGKRDYFLMAPSKAIFENAIQKMELFMEFNCNASAEEIQEAVAGDADDDESFDGAEGYESLIEHQMDSSSFETICFFLLFPFRLLMHLTVPDVRMLDENGEPTATIGKAFLSTLSCLIWLIVGSYAMVASLEVLGKLM
eukprot:CAMPEP_0197191504 /NCGR_PEP_ID=MMETSP1423-20130617/23527_1 /TAXON_ID=476441 /ORGANISM="Pseudo-nitzschia heimii, Strain UNC1101" /LENGTH=361 /DNA_ID=CAMNT_0042644161 /DNA_START=44 /DNA_END=1126 /DNA_ORIENTATION=+